MDDESRFRLWSQIIGGVFSTMRYGILAFVIIKCAAYANDSISALAGKQTSANIVIDFLAKFGIDRYLAYIFGTGGLIYGYRQKKLRQKNIKRLTQQNAETEKRLDPNRTSSALTPEGETRTEDK